MLFYRLIGQLLARLGRVLGHCLWLSGFRQAKSFLAGFGKNQNSSKFFVNRPLTRPLEASKRLCVLFYAGYVCLVRKIRSPSDLLILRAVERFPKCPQKLMLMFVPLANLVLTLAPLRPSRWRKRLLLTRVSAPIAVYVSMNARSKPSS